jgi:hypothetical protein
MTIDNLINNFKQIGYHINYSEHDPLTNIWKNIKQLKQLEVDRKEKTWNITWDKPYPQGTQNYLSFTLFECVQLNKNGIEYKPDNQRQYYFFNFNNDVSEIYDNNSIDKLYNGIITYINNTIKDEDKTIMRDYKINSLITNITEI